MTEAFGAVELWVFWASVEAIETAGAAVVPPLDALSEGIWMLVLATAAGAAEVWPLVALVWVGLAGYAVIARWSA